MDWALDRTDGGCCFSFGGVVEQGQEHHLTAVSSFRCRGHCCRRFAIEHRYGELQADFARWQVDPATSRIPDIEKIAPMVIPVLPSFASETESLYTCKHLHPNGDCGIYETRPQMCRDFPGPEGCHFRKCESSVSSYFGMSRWKRIWTRWKWLRGLG